MSNIRDILTHRRIAAPKTEKETAAILATLNRYEHLGSQCVNGGEQYYVIHGITEKAAKECDLRIAIMRKQWENAIKNLETHQMCSASFSPFDMPQNVDPDADAYDSGEKTCSLADTLLWGADPRQEVLFDTFEWYIKERIRLAANDDAREKWIDVMTLLHQLITEHMIHFTAAFNAKLKPVLDAACAADWRARRFPNRSASISNAEVLDAVNAGRQEASNAAKETRVAIQELKDDLLSRWNEFWSKNKHVTSGKGVKKRITTPLHTIHRELRPVMDAIVGFWHKFQRGGLDDQLTRSQFDGLVLNRTSKRTYLECLTLFSSEVVFVNPSTQEEYTLGDICPNPERLGQIINASEKAQKRRESASRIKNSGQTADKKTKK